MGPSARAAALAILLVALVAAPASADTFTVNTTLDGTDSTSTDGICSASLPGVTACTLRAAVQQANTTPAADIIVLPANPKPYTLTLNSPSPEDASATGDLDITQPITIDGGGARGTTVQQTRPDRVLDVLSGPGTVTVEGLTITGGAPAAGIGDGAGLRNRRALTELTDV